MTRKEKKSADSFIKYDRFITRQWHKFKGAEIKGGVLECALEKRKPVCKKGTVHLYGLEYFRPMIGGIVNRCKDFCQDEKYIVSFEGKIEWDRHIDYHRLT